MRLLYRGCSVYDTSNKRPIADSLFHPDLWRLLRLDTEEPRPLSARGVRIDGDVDLRSPRHRQQHDQLLGNLVPGDQPRVECLRNEWMTTTFITDYHHPYNHYHHKTDARRRFRFRKQQQQFDVDPKNNTNLISLNLGEQTFLGSTSFGDVLRRHGNRGHPGHY